MQDSLAVAVVRPADGAHQEQERHHGSSNSRSVYECMDSLPYIDRELELPGMRAAVDSLVEQEMAKISKQSAAARRALDALPANVDDLFASAPLWRSELARVQSRAPLPALDSARYALPDVEEMKKEEEQGCGGEGVEREERRWRSAIERVKTGIEHISTQGINAELAAKFGSNAWLVHNFQLEHATALIQAETEKLNRQSVEVNKERKREQLQLGAALYAASEEWNQLIGSILRTNLACAALEADIAQLSARREDLGMNQ